MCEILPERLEGREGREKKSAFPVLLGENMRSASQKVLTPIALTVLLQESRVTETAR